MRSRFFFLAGSALLASVLLLASPAAVAGGRPDKGGPYQVNLRLVSGPSPFAGGCPGARFDDQTITGHELEPAITVNLPTRATSWRPGSRTSARPTRRAPI